MSLIKQSLEHIYCSNLVSNHVLIRLIKFASRFTIHLYNAIYFSTTFSTSCKRFIKILCFAFTPSKHGLNTWNEMFEHDQSQRPVNNSKQNQVKLTYINILLKKKTKDSPWTFPSSTTLAGGSPSSDVSILLGHNTFRIFRWTTKPFLLPGLA